MIRRRQVLTLLGGAAVAWPAVAVAQPPERTRRIGYLSLSSGPAARQDGAFELGLQELGYKLGQDVTIDYRWAAGRLEHLPAFAKELVESRPDIIVVVS